MEPPTGGHTEQFRAGKMILQDNRLVADPRKGLIRVMEAAHCVQLHWFRREGAEPISSDAELIVALLPETKVSLVSRPGARILELSLGAGSNHFFWLQEPAAFDADALISRLNSHVPPAAALQQPSVSAAEPEPMETSHPAAASTAASRGMSYSQAAAADAPGHDGGGSSNSIGRLDAAQLAAILSGLGAAGGGLDADATNALQQMQRRAAAGPSLAEVLKPEVTVPLALQEGMLERLAPFMPEGQRTQHHLQIVLESPQFRRQLDMFNAALVSGQLDLRHFGLQPNGFGVADFLEAVDQAARSAKKDDGS